MSEYTEKKFKQLLGSWARKLGKETKIKTYSRGEKTVVQKRKSNYNVLQGSVINTIDTVVIMQRMNTVLTKITMGNWQAKKHVCV